MGAIARLIRTAGCARPVLLASPNAPFFVGALVTAPAILLALAAGRAAGRLGPHR